jgi:hypothetical protein
MKLLVFGFPEYYPQGGMNDYLGTVNGIDEALELIKNDRGGFNQYYQLVRGTKVVKNVFKDCDDELFWSDGIWPEVRMTIVEGVE